jgi:nucleoside-diphosphate-sugar epimerase
MGHHLILGAGGIGLETAIALTRRGEQVTIGSRSGTDPGLPGVTATVVDATDADALTTASAGVDTIINAMNPKSYVHWDRDWPPVAHAVLSAAQRSEVGLVTVSNLYGYGRVDAPMTEETPMRPNGTKGAVRAAMWADALAAHDAGRVRATELRASDYLGERASKQMSFLTEFVLSPAFRGRTSRIPMGRPDVQHSWTYLADIGELAATLATDDRSWGHAWLVPTDAPRTMNQAAADAAELGGQAGSRVTPWPRWLQQAARVSALIRSLDETRHQFEQPFVMDSRHTEQTFGLAPTPWATALERTLRGAGAGN